MAFSSTAEEPGERRKQTVGNISYLHFGGRLSLDMICERAWSVWYTLDSWERCAWWYWAIQEKIHKSQLRITAESPYNTGWLDNKCQMKHSIDKHKVMLLG